MKDHWRVLAGEVWVTVEEAEWWGASLAVLVAVVHHPGVLVDRQPDTDPAEVARQVLAQVDGLYRAAARADEQDHGGDGGGGRGSGPVRRDGDAVVFSPGAEVANLALCLEIFACAVLDGSGADATVARGASAYAAAAWSADIGWAAGTLAPPPHRPVGGEVERARAGWADGHSAGIDRKAGG